MRRKRAFEPRAVRPDEHLTSQDIYEHIVFFGGVQEWARSVGQDPRAVQEGVLAWRRSVRVAQIEQMARDLAEQDVNGRAIKWALGRSPKKVAKVPAVSRQEIAADAAHIAQWGYV